MEPQTNFDLEQALRAWKDDCASRPGISFDNARELESDLRERVADLQQQGLSEKEAFSTAVRQVGSLGELAREFARENPLSVWRERLFWIIAASFALSIWSLLSSGPMLWFVNTFGVWLPVRAPAWFALCGNLPLLALAILLASGRLEKVAARMRFFSRRHLALAGGGLLAVALLVRLFGPYPLTAPESLPVKVFSLCLWPLLLLSLAVNLFRPARGPKSATSDSGPLQLPAAVWRERVFWIAVGGLAVGVWRTVTWVSIQTMFYTGDINKPFMFGPLLVGSWLLIELSPLIVLGLLLRQRMRTGKDATVGKLVRSQALFAFIPIVVVAETAMALWSQYHWKPAGVDISWPGMVGDYFMNLRWLWPAGLALLILWLAGEKLKEPEASPAPGISAGRKRAKGVNQHEMRRILRRGNEEANRALP